MYTPPQTTTGRASSPPMPELDEIQAALVNLGVGQMSSNRPQAHTLEAEVEDYLAAPCRYSRSIVDYWQVCRNLFHFIEKY
jgi:L-2-hydroxyglutarate oxidase LhgO